MVDSIKWKIAEAKEQATEQAKPMQFWLDSEPTSDLIVSQINVLLGKMHGRKRQEAREKISAKVKTREQKRKEENRGRVIKTVVGKNSCRSTCPG